jgi:hypothetical protein
MKSFHNLKKILTVLKKVLTILENFRAILENKVLKRMNVIPLNATEKQIQKVITLFNSRFSSAHENCQATQRKRFKSIPLKIDCLVLKVYVGAEGFLVATAIDNEQNSFLFHEAKELRLVSCTCKAGEWPCSELIDFKEGTEPCQEAKEKVLAKKMG